MTSYIKEKVRSLLNKIYFRWLTTRYFIGKPQVLYHPLPWLGLEKAKRGKGCQARLDFILNEIGAITGSVLDFGCAEGFFSISLAQKGFLVTGLEQKKDRVRIAQLASDMVGVENLCFLNLKVNEVNISNFPRFDFTLCLAVWHHWVRFFGFDSAKKMLKILWQKTNCIMFFETGLSELPDSFNMPEICGDPDKWLHKLLEELLPDSAVEVLGEAASFPPEQFTSKDTKFDSNSYKRKIYKIERISARDNT
ncbi:MAG: methyltransferase domain-containing protein [Candidatus Peribacteraceae bacterium]|nr:methyltransferase domain-containing protein [Candidatus Peribacteraceae bacterium]